jgi:DNA-binding MarR family transcriptional regulator
MNRSRVDEVSECNCTAMRKASRRLSQMYDGALAPVGLKSTQYSILVQIERRSAEPPTLRELADALVMDRSTMGQNLRPLERDLLIELAMSDTDRRRRQVVLTKQGRARLAEARALWRTAQARFEQNFGLKASANLREVLHQIATDPELAHPGQMVAAE